MEQETTDLTQMDEEEIVSFLESALDRLSVESLMRVGSLVAEKRQAKQEEARTSARVAIEQQLQRSGLSLGDLFPELVPGRKRTQGEPVPPKFQGPNGELWTGRGHEPRWLQALVAEGRNKEEFLIAKDVG